MAIIEQSPALNRLPPDGPDCSRASGGLAGDPPPRPDRWLPQRKAEVVAAVHGGVLSLDEALNRYALTLEEYLEWQHALGRFGIAGLRVGAARERREARADGS